MGGKGKGEEKKEKGEERNEKKKERRERSKEKRGGRRSHGRLNQGPVEDMAEILIHCIAFPLVSRV